MSLCLLSLPCLAALLFPSPSLLPVCVHSLRALISVFLSRISFQYYTIVCRRAAHSFGNRTSERFTNTERNLHRKTISTYSIQIMDILVQKPIFCSSSEYYELPSSNNYTPYNTPPCIGYQAGSSSSWQQMQYLRFPTPPITPPRIITVSDCAGTRTQSVIMKCSKSVISASGSPTESCSEHSSCSSECDFICNWQECGRVFESLDALAQHVTLRHAIASMADGLYYCHWVGCQRSERGFNARYKMLVHVRTHTKEKPHRCHLCEKSFSRAENLKIHIRSHSGEKPYKCHYEGCQKAYSNSSDRFKHTRTHSMEKPYVCKVSGCQKRYTDPSSLRKHVKTFKHSIQLIASQSSSNCLLDASEVPYSCLPMPLPLHPAPIVAPCESLPNATAYYLDMRDNENVANDYSLRSKHNSEYASSEYWLNTQEHGAYRYLHSADYSMDMEMDTPTPLDLRVHRS